jgi:hypothetical protein
MKRKHLLTVQRPKCSIKLVYAKSATNPQQATAINNICMLLTLPGLRINKENFHNWIYCTGQGVMPKPKLVSQKRFNAIVSMSKSTLPHMAFIMPTISKHISKFT